MTDDTEDLARRVYLAGYKDSRGVSSLDGIKKRTAITLFERWWEINAE